MSDPNVKDLLARLETLEAAFKGRTASAQGVAEDVLASNAETPNPLSDAGRPGRRDLLRYGSLAALGAAAVGLAPRQAEAANGDIIRVSQFHVGTGQTELNTSGTGVAAFEGRATNPVGPTAGLVGVTQAANGAPGNEPIGVLGDAQTDTGLCAGVAGVTASRDGMGVFGLSDANTGFTAGVSGEASSPTGYGMFARNMAGHGIAGITGASGGVAIIGNNSNVAGAFAGVFVGPVYVSGNFTVGGTKSAVVPHPDGSHRLVYCVESPESWFEDFGKGKLQRGQADVVIDPDFAAVVDMDDYHVFVTPYDENPELLVTSRTNCGFRVKAKDETSSADFSWRLVARRKDVDPARLAKTDVPATPPVPEAWRGGLSWRKRRTGPANPLKG
jgi:hypothetical protein